MNHLMSAPQHQVPPQYAGDPPTMMAGSAPQMSDGGNPQIQGPPLNIGGPNILGHPGAGIANPIAQPSSLPWTVGSTDGTFATMTLMQQRNQHHQQSQQQQQQQPPPWNSGGGGSYNSAASVPSLAQQRNQLQQQQGAPWNPGGGGGHPSGASISSASPPSQIDPNTGVAIGEEGQATATNNLAQLAAVQS
jgi:hypothetical protein